MPLSPQPSDSTPTLQKLNLVVSIVLALLGGFISLKQVQLTEEQQRMSGLIDQQAEALKERQTITQQSAELLSSARKSLDGLDLPPQSRKHVLISLLQIEKELRVSKTGELSDTAVNALPFHIALLAADSQALAHIGGTAEDLDLWLPIAKTSADVKMRQAAIDALKNVALLTGDPATLIRCLDEIIELTQRWNVAELREQARTAITDIANAYRQVDGSQSREINAAFGRALRELEGAVVAFSPATPLEAPGAATPPDATAQAGLQEATDAARQASPMGEQAPGIPQMRQLRQFYELSGEQPADLQASLGALQSEDPRVRRIARSRVSDFGQEAIPKLTAMLQAEGGDGHRARVGVVTALLLMDQPVRLSEEQARAVVAMLGDVDESVRQNTAVFLAKLSDPRAIEAARGVIETLANEQANLEKGNLIYNGVVVLGNWLRYNPALSPDARKRVRAALKAIDGQLKQDQARQWTVTRNKIQAYLGK